ncbi:Serpin domain containing protein, partial [Asbolus verrucosus]
FKLTFSYSECEKLNAQFLELTFEGGNASVVITLPKEEEGPAALENQILSPRRFYGTFVNISLPNLKSKKFVTAFCEKEADLSGIAGCKDDLLIDNAVQKTFVDVGEDGVEAAAATMARVFLLCEREFCRYFSPLSGCDDPIPNYMVDHPFFSSIKIKENIAFAGRVTDPNQ